MDDYYMCEMSRVSDHELDGLHKMQSSWMRRFFKSWMHSSQMLLRRASAVIPFLGLSAAPT